MDQSILVYSPFSDPLSLFHTDLLDYWFRSIELLPDIFLLYFSYSYGCGFVLFGFFFRIKFTYFSNDCYLFYQNSDFEIEYNQQKSQYQSAASH